MVESWPISDVTVACVGRTMLLDEGASLDASDTPASKTEAVDIIVSLVEK
jgi:hypothetical protein